MPLLTIRGIAFVIMLLFYILAIVLKKGQLGFLLILIGTFAEITGIVIDKNLAKKRSKESKNGGS